MDCWQSQCVAGVLPRDPTMQKTQLQFAYWLADYAHSKGMSVGQKVDPAQRCCLPQWQARA
jgi:hypothetical protein